MKKSSLDEQADSVEGPVEGDLDASNVDDEMGPLPAIIVDIFDGQVPDDTNTSRRICSLEGGLRVVSGPRLDTLQEGARLLEISIERYAVPTLSGDAITAFVSIRAMDGVVPFMRIDGRVDDGYLYANIQFADGSEQSIQRAAVISHDDVTVLIHRIVAHAQTQAPNG
ncbi:MULTISPECIES: hypothetical protein [unclassified Caballeronia]|uniref:hypothetical protein n=1 Tax=unclassified Caballeronia TaxID=2646786 RepID=UPI002028E910|nr:MULTISPECIES: hypothetical protein [unclassified Caballeronia]MDR5765898.1 hypothetical protein [Caballeronia sp. LZ028]